jgi:hypothetical protein
MSGRSTRKRPWGPTGAVTAGEPRLGGDAREHIELIVTTGAKRRGIEPLGVEGFLDGVAEAIGLYDGMVKLRQQTETPAEIRNKLGAAAATAMKLLRQMERLNSNSKMLVEEAARERDAHGLIESCARVAEALVNAARMAEEYPTSGALPAAEPVILIQRVAEALEARLGVKPTTTRGALLEEVVAVVLEEATGVEVKEPHKLILRALAPGAKRVHPGGLTEYGL